MKRFPVFLSDFLEQFYWHIVDDGFGMEIKKFNEDIYYKHGLRFPDKRLARYRGLLFEEIFIEVVRPRFENSQFETGCQIYINNACVIISYGEGNAFHKKTLDVAGWIPFLKYLVLVG